MKVTDILFISAAGTLIPSALAWPGMKGIMADLDKELHSRETEAPDVQDSTELIGDLATIGAVTPVGKQVQGVILGQIDPYSDDTYTPPGRRGTRECAADTCCIWSWIAADMKSKFKGASGRCTGLARAAVRMGFHDAGSWSKTSTNGGADGSLILAGEISRPENNGLQDIIAYTQGLYNTYHPYGVGMADLIQMAATVATVVCPLGPRIRSYVGRVDSNKPAPDGLLPSVNADANSLIQLFADKTIKPHGLAALVGAHTTSQQRFVNPARAFDPQDSTPGVWDVVFYNQTIQPTSAIPKRVFKFQSDVVLSQHPQIAPEWQKFASGNQEDWNEDFAREYVRLSLLGVNNINNLTECTKVLPAASKSFNVPDLPIITLWLTGKFPLLGQFIDGGSVASNGLVALLGYFLS